MINVLKGARGQMRLKTQMMIRVGFIVGPAHGGVGPDGRGRVDGATLDVDRLRYAANAEVF